MATFHVSCSDILSNKFLTGAGIPNFRASADKHHCWSLVSLTLLHCFTFKWIGKISMRKCVNVCLIIDNFLITEPLNPVLVNNHSSISSSGEHSGKHHRPPHIPVAGRFSNNFRPKGLQFDQVALYLRPFGLILMEMIQQFHARG